MSVLGYYPGCSLSGTAKEYDASLRAVAAALGVELREVPDWICCGATSAHAIDRDAALCMAADTLAKARRAGMEQILAPCAMCYQRLASASHELEHHAGLPGRVATALGEPKDFGIEKVRPISLLKWLDSTPGDSITEKVKLPLKGLKVACYYGCLLVRPASVTGEKDVETPRSMERVVRLLGGEAVRWSMATECCGGSFALSRKSVVLRQGERIVDAARKAGANLLCMACPMCQANLDMRQAEFTNEPLPALYLTQLMGLAFGLDEKTLGLTSHFVPFTNYAVRITE